MKLIFIDETGDKKHSNYLGICVAIVDAANYGSIKHEFQQTLRNSSWDESIEFKGSHLFSASKGDPYVDVDERIDIVDRLLNLNKARMNARMVFHFGSQWDVKDAGQAYLSSLPSFLNKVLPKPLKGGRSKNLLSIVCDYRDDVRDVDVQAAILPVLEDKGWELFEHVSMIHSNFHTIGILFADIVGYLAGRVDTIGSDADLFEGIPQSELEKHGKYRKLVSSTRLLGLIKEINLYEKVAI